ncbi:hypothetical protein [Rhizorhabdus wittichii]|uniref:hypothetical protein n=1 Tax=Rhizorhabdus wittichii TaxID=160791 RepID=UPI0012FDE489|nr:hypothetical protein [Rhizorhabdus wittichii]
MAFTKIDSWEVAPAPRQKVCAARPIVAFQERRLRRLLGGTTTLGIHVAAILLLLAKFDQAPVRNVHQSSALTMLDLGRAPEGEVPSDDQAAPSSEVVATPTTPQQAAVPSEWGVVKIKIARPIVLDGNSGAADARPAGATGGGFDPYAGAAPENIDRLLQKSALTGAPSGSSTKDVLTDAVRQKLLKIEPNLRLPLTVRLVIDADGRVLTMTVIRSALPTDAALRLQARLRGAMLPTQAKIPAGQTRQIDISL